MKDSLQSGPPRGDWLGTGYLHFERHGPFARCIVDRPASRNAMTPAMYFGVRYASNHVDADDGLAGLLVTGTGDVFIPGGDLGGSDEDDWGDLRASCTWRSPRSTPFARPANRWYPR